MYVLQIIDFAQSRAVGSVKREKIWVPPRMETESALATVRQPTGYHRVSNLESL